MSRTRHYRPCLPVILRKAQRTLRVMKLPFLAKNAKTLESLELRKPHGAPQLHLFRLTPCESPLQISAGGCFPLTPLQSQRHVTHKLKDLGNLRRHNTSATRPPSEVSENHRLGQEADVRLPREGLLRSLSAAGLEVLRDLVDMCVPWSFQSPDLVIFLTWRRRATTKQCPAEPLGRSTPS